MYVCTCEADDNLHRLTHQNIPSGVHNKCVINDLNAPRLAAGGKHAAPISTGIAL